MIQSPPKHTYIYDGNIDFSLINKDMLNNRLLCTFVHPSNVDSLIEEIQSRYTVLYNKMFVLELSEHPTEVVVTYNIDHGNVTSIIENSILVHRKKDFNVLYSLNSLNELIKKLNNGLLDNHFIVNWQDYKNSILLTQNGEFHQLKTKIKKIVEL